MILHVNRVESGTRQPKATNCIKLIATSHHVFSCFLLVDTSMRAYTQTHTHNGLLCFKVKSLVALVYGFLCLGEHF